MIEQNAAENEILYWNTGQGTLSLKKSQIEYCQAAGVYTHLFLEQQNQVTLSQPLCVLEIILGKSKFFRCNRSILINLDTIAAFSSIEHHVELKSGKKLKFAKKVKEQLRTKILDNICCK